MQVRPFITEITEFLVEPRNHHAFERALRDAFPIVLAQPGVLFAEFGKVIEPAEGFFLLIGWQRLEDHVERFRGSDDFERFVGHFRPLLRHPARVLHLRSLFHAGVGDMAR